MVIFQNFCGKFSNDKTFVEFNGNQLQFPVYVNLSKNKEMSFYLEVRTSIEETSYLGLLSPL